MADQTLEAIIKLKDEITKPLQNVQRELNNVNKTSSNVNSAMKNVQNSLDNTKKAAEPVSKELINKLLLKGEVEDLVDAINNLSDLKKIEKAEDEIKN